MYKVLFYCKLNEHDTINGLYTFDVYFDPDMYLKLISTFINDNQKAEIRIKLLNKNSKNDRFINLNNAYLIKNDYEGSYNFNKLSIKNTNGIGNNGEWLNFRTNFGTDTINTSYVDQSLNLKPLDTIDNNFEYFEYIGGTNKLTREYLESNFDLKKKN